jgi:hypothetical protein
MKNIKLCRLIQSAIAAAVLFFVATGCGQKARSAESNVLSGTSSEGCSDEVLWETNTVSGMNEVLYQQSLANLGNTIGNGECSDLPDQILQNNGGKSFTDLGPTGLDADYVWGDVIATLSVDSPSLDGILPGDVLQYRDVHTSHRVTREDGSWTSSTSEAIHHTSVVKAVSTDGRAICVFEQNTGGNRFVQTGTVWVDGLESGTIWAYRPLFK